MANHQQSIRSTEDEAADQREPSSDRHTTTAEHTTDGHTTAEHPAPGRGMAEHAATDTPDSGAPSEPGEPGEPGASGDSGDSGDSGEPSEPSEPSEPGEPGASEGTALRRRRRRRRRRIALAVLAALVVVIAFAMRNPSPVGHWDSAEGQDRYLAAYAEAFEDLPEPDQTQDLRTDYGFVRVYRFEGTGDAEAPMVLLPGTASGAPVMADNLPSLLEIGDVYLIDLLGEPGRSVQERPITSSAEQADWLDQALAQLDEDTVHVVGLSIGGWTGVNLALHAPGRVETLTLMDPVNVFDDMPLETIVRSIPAAFPWLPKSWRDGFNSYTAGGAPVEEVPVAEMIEAGMQHYRMKLPQPERISPDQLSTLDIPVLALIAGESVMHDPPTATETAEQALTDGTVRVYPEASHAINGEYPEQIAVDIEEFLADHE
ncbi:alpha/beta fold hydrolase [Ruania zhangjianzhongii]|uniref:alpha/beta fold hydrolase n=1 Tax=Ruania zhangjianzhongii TaxID=2603206 RepID=UPI001F46AA23|nr:alpha/beta hydrolase [Ruania zhangjianzhongii]